MYLLTNFYDQSNQKWDTQSPLIKPPICFKLSPLYASVFSPLIGFNSVSNFLFPEKKNMTIWKVHAFLSSHQDSCFGRVDFEVKQTQVRMAG